ncbi:LysR family transcriptional regulator [Kiloniella sp.]|uniref:LysR family transcriptional regulator n=1 Tax=Kiloniella sp. TaxID=1938587 RepID=UPI003B021044
MIGSVTLEQWRIFHAVIKYGGYANAARELNKSHSSLHHALSKMQDLLGVSLLRTEGKSLVLTAEGEVLLRRSSRLLENSEELRMTAKTLSQGWETELSIAVESIFPTNCLFNTLKAFYPKSRGCRLRIKDTVMGATTAAIANKEVDLAIASFLPKGHSGTSLVDVEMLTVVHSSHPLAQRSGSISERDLAGYLQIVISEKMPEDTESVSAKSRGWLKAEQRWTVDSIGAALSCLYQGMGFCLLPRHEVADDLASGTFVSLHVENILSPKIWLTLVVPKPETLGPAGRLLRDLFLERINDSCLKEQSKII